MDTIQKIREGFAYLRTSSKRSVTLKEDYFYIVKIDGMQGIAIEIETDKHVNEKFSDISYYTKEYLIDGEERHLLLLVSKNQRLFADFAIICAGFLEKVLDAETYQEIKKDPLSWWHTIKELIGNANVEKTAYSVLAEMLCYYHLLKKGHEASWVGPLGSSVDIDTNEGSYEVKSTLSRYGSEITVNSQYQLKAKYLMFFRFEPDDFGISIQDLALRLIGLGIDESRIENALEYLKYPNGSEIRSKSYRLLEVTKYNIDESFPRILPESFIDGKMPKHITGLIYKLDLSGLVGDAVDLCLNHSLFTD